MYVCCYTHGWICGVVVKATSAVPQGTRESSVPASDLALSAILIAVIIIIIMIVVIIIAIIIIIIIIIRIISIMIAIISIAIILAVIAILAISTCASMSLARLPRHAAALLSSVSVETSVSSGSCASLSLSPSLSLSLLTLGGREFESRKGQLSGLGRSLYPKSAEGFPP